MIRGSSGLPCAQDGQLRHWGPVAALVMSAVTSWLAVTRFGVGGLTAAIGGVLLVAAAVALVLRRPELIFAAWIVAMSSFTYFGLLRMPGVPDLSVPRLFLIVTLFMIAAGTMAGRPLFKAPLLPDLLLLVHTFYVLANLKTIGNPGAFHSWYNSSLAPFVAYVFAKQYVQSDLQLRNVTYAILLILCYYGITAFGEHFEIDAIVWPRQVMDRTIMSPYFGRARGPFFQPGVFGMMIGMFLLLNVLALTRRHGAKMQAVLWMNLVLAGLALLYTYTRGGWVATLVGLIFLVLLRPRFRRLAVVLVLAAVVLGSLNVVSSDKNEVLADRMSNTGTIENRLGTLATESRMIREYPFFGVGYFRYMELEHLYNQGTHFPFYGYVRKEMGAGVPIHDIFLGRAAEEGLISLGLFLWFLLEVARTGIRKWRVAPTGMWFDRDTIAVLGAIIVTYLLGGMVEDFRYFDNVNVVAYFMAGVLVGFPVRPSVAVGFDSAPRSGREATVA